MRYCVCGGGAAAGVNNGRRTLNVLCFDAAPFPICGNYIEVLELMFHPFRLHLCQFLCCCET